MHMQEKNQQRVPGKMMDYVFAETFQNWQSLQLPALIEQRVLFDDLLRFLSTWIILQV